MSRLNVLVSGGAGYIASHVTLALLERGYQPILVDNFSNSSPEALRRVEALAGEKLPFYEVDLTDRVALERVFQENEIHAAIHFAGLKAVGESVAKPLEYYENNLLSTIHLSSLMKQYGVKVLVFSSSATVYGVPEQLPLEETMPTSCTNPYGWTKWMCEQILSDFQKAYSEASVILLRYFNPIGAHPSGQIGENPNGIPNNLMPYITQVAVGRLPQLRVFGDDYDTKDGSGVRDYIHVMDLAEGHVAALDFALKHQGVEVFNLGTGQGISVLELIKAFEEASQQKIPYEVVERRPGDVAACYADASKAKKLLKWEAKRGLQAMCEDAWRFQEQNPNGY